MLTVQQQLIGLDRTEKDPLPNFLSDQGFDIHTHFPTFRHSQQDVHLFNTSHHFVSFHADKLCLFSVSLIISQLGVRYDTLNRLSISSFNHLFLTADLAQSSLVFVLHMETLLELNFPCDSFSLCSVLSGNFPLNINIVIRYRIMGCK